ncbi:ATPase H+ transporting accessory protein 1 like a [Polymixia lowei]
MASHMPGLLSTPQTDPGGGYFRHQELQFPSPPSRWRSSGQSSPVPSRGTSEKVLSNGKPCILFRARKLAIRYQNHSLVDLTERAFSTEYPADTKGSVCSKNKAMLVMRFGDVEDLRSLSIKLQMSSTFYESAGQTWFSVDSISLHYNWSEEACFNASELYAPSTSSYHCQHVSSLPRYNTLLLPTSSDNARHWHITFTDFQIQAFNVMSGKFAPASDCATFFTPGILMGLITSLILLLVLAYALHMVIHLKHIDHDDQHKTTVYFPCSPEQAEHRSVSNASDAEKNML